MHIISKSRLVTVLTILIIAAFGGKAGTAHAQEVYMGPDYSSCYSYTGLGYTTPTISVNLKTSGGQTSTITIPNQNPPSILQSMAFQQNTNCGWEWNGFADIWNGIYLTSYSSQYGLNFKTSTGTTIPYVNSPFTYTFDSSEYYPGYGSYASLGGWYYEGLSDMGYSATTEDAVINNIASTGKFNNQVVDAGGDTYGDFANVSAPATNCVALSGTGPKKIVFMRGSATNSNTSDFLVWANTTINSGFATIDPYKSYLSQFSFYADLKKTDESNIPRSSGNGSIQAGSVNVFNSSSASYVKSQSSCGGGASVYIMFFGDSTVYPLITADNVSFVDPLIFKTLSFGTTGNVGFPDTVVHEVSHAIAFLGDEYIQGTTFSGAIGDENCVHNPYLQFKNDGDGRLYAGIVPGDSNAGQPFYGGCTVYSDSHGDLYRPSNISIMNSKSNYFPKFNVISCGYVVSAILGEPVDKAHAQTHWPTCYNNMDTRKAEVPPVAPAPVVNTVTPTGTNTFNAAGSSFTPTGNSVKLTPTTSGMAPSSVLPANSYSGFQLFKDFFQKLIPQAHGQTNFYEIDGLSSDGSGLNFTVPSTTPDGTYTVSVSGFNSPWTATTQTITVSGNGSGNPTTANGGYLGSGASGGTGTGTTCSSGYVLSGSTCVLSGGTTSGNTVAGTPVPSVAATAAIKYTYYNEPFTGCLSGEVSVENPGSPGQYFCQHATTTYSCPSGYVVSGSTCNPTPAYTCPSGYTLNGATCIVTPAAGSLPTSILATVGCVGGSFYTLSLPGSTSPYNNNTPYYHCVYVSGATGLWTDYGRATNICPAGYLTGLPTYNNLDAYNGTALCKPVVTPTSLTGVAGTGVNGISVGKVSLSWSNPTYALTASNVLVEASSNNGAYSVIATLSGSANSYIDTGIPLSTNRKYQIRVLFSNGAYGSYSNSINVTTPSVNYFPSPVLSLIQNWATGTTKPELQGIENLYYLLPDMSAYTSSPARVSVERSVSSSTGFIEVGTSDDFSLDSKGKWTSNQSGWAMPANGRFGVGYYFYTDTNTPSAATIYYRLRFRFADGTYSPYSSIVSAAPATPKAPVLKISTKAETSLGLSWTNNKQINNGNPSFTITPIPSIVLASTTRKYTVTDLIPSTQYCYTVNLVYNPANITPSTQVCATTDKSVAPSGFSAKASGQTIALKWKDAGNVSLERSISKTTGFIAVITSSSTSYTDNAGLAPSTIYYYRLRKVYSDGSFGTYSNVVNAKTAVVTASANITTPDTTVQSKSDTTTTAGKTTGTTVTQTTAPSSASVFPTTSTSCPSGYVKYNGACKNLASTIPLNTTYSCPTGYTLNSTTKMCDLPTPAATTTDVSVPQTTIPPTTAAIPTNIAPATIQAPIPATVTYTCSSGYVLNGSQCTLTTTIPATAKTSCPTGYVKLNNTCKNLKGTIDLITSYSCSSGYSLNVDGTTCSTSSVTVPATATYSCPTESILDNATKTCTQSTSAAFATSTTTASVFDSITHWFGWFFGW